MANVKTTKLTLVDEVRGEFGAYEVMTTLFKGIDKDWFETSVYSIKKANNQVDYSNCIAFERFETLGEALVGHLRTVGKMTKIAR